MKLKLYLQKATKHKNKIPLRKEFIRWTTSTLKTTQQSVLPDYKELEVTIRLIDETESAQLNQQYRHKAGPTNVLSFGTNNEVAILDNLIESTYYLGDLAICVPLVFQEAIEQNKSLIAHWAHLTIHGILHLLGYDHVKHKDAITMEGLEIVILEELGYKNPYN